MHLGCAVECSRSRASSRRSSSSSGYTAPAPIVCPHCRTEETRLEHFKTDEAATVRKNDKVGFEQGLCDAIIRVTAAGYVASAMDLRSWLSLMRDAEKFCKETSDEAEKSFVKATQTKIELLKQVLNQVAPTWDLPPLPDQNKFEHLAQTSYPGDESHDPKTSGYPNVLPVKVGGQYSKPVKRLFVPGLSYWPRGRVPAKYSYKHNPTETPPRLVLSDTCAG